tara:strand:- start:3039 stop:3632 length:594 start_codon:yes stop_codon:yes gene_type:complete
MYRLLTNLHIEGKENIPSHSGCLLTINHLSLYDPPLALSFWSYSPEALGAEKTMYNNGIIGIIMRWYGTFPVKRDGDDRAALRTALKVLQNDLPLLIAPEGTRHPEGLRDPQHGASFLAMKTGVPLVPIAISGTADIFSTLRKGRKQKVEMIIGKPYHLPTLSDTPRRDALRIHTEYIMQRIADLLPERHRGIYKKQ